jgi:hypothetical protein
LSQRPKKYDDGDDDDDDGDDGDDVMSRRVYSIKLLVAWQRDKSHRMSAVALRSCAADKRWMDV